MTDAGAFCYAFSHRRVMGAARRSANVSTGASWVARIALSVYVAEALVASCHARSALIGSLHKARHMNDLPIPMGILEHGRCYALELHHG